MPFEEAPRPSNTIVLSERWRRYRTTRNRDVRDQLILAYSPIVKYAAGRIASRMPPHVDVADLVSYGLGGLIDAVERFEPERGTTFETYAGQRIRGAIFDELRALDWVPRTVRAEAREIELATADLSTRLQRLPTDAELAEQLDMDADQLDASLQRVADARIVALDKPWNLARAEGVQPTLLETLADPAAVDPADSADAQDLRERIAAAIERLPARDQVVLGLRYHQELTFLEIGTVLGVSESRVCQMHAKAVLQVGALMPDEVLSAWG
ncbi:MAG TPA: FliA/WhiG family RNA polymerase sigma factor [Baekduia sp.]|uniref:FliA/WhiG family RNA polymerase sigma factor n=1 Tax=Baekduia sp. TaxID=2600305 RepID=UPI002B824F27|nr:FliA/WhiG family RNA polymerase sigma factor [Baekduia sp.]HMJ36524.1 FliA/WhiG family RNA polymerase sigma factor [Baekduia sp.]